MAKKGRKSNPRVAVPEEYNEVTKKWMARLIRVIHANDLLTDLDTAGIEQIGYYHHLYILAKDILEKEGLVIYNARGEPTKAHPAVKIAHDSEIKIYRMLKEYKLTPKSREKLDLLTEETPLDMFLKGKVETR